LEDSVSDSPRGGGLRKAAMGGGVLALTAMVFGGVELAGVLKRPTSAQAASNPPVTTAVVQAPDALDSKKLADQSELLDQARALMQKREYAKAEDIYRAILKSDPSNSEVKHLLASVLFRQEKIDESVKVLNSISEEKPSQSPQR
jgi:cytochrome c-type biogenesis protein CcmH/NrfG